jgi:hypothetical protein
MAIHLMSPTAERWFTMPAPSVIDRIDRASQERLALRLRRSRGDRSEATKLADQELTSQLEELWRERRTTTAAADTREPLVSFD